MRDRQSRCRVVLICGMHRSGASLAAHMLADAGISLGNGLLDERVADTGESCGEHPDVARHHENLLALLGRRWYEPEGALPLPAEWLDWPETRQIEAALVEIVRAETKDRSVWAMKDARTARLLPLWKRVLETIDLDASVLFCTRHPDHVAGSLMRRHAMSASLAFAICSRFYDAAGQALRMICSSCAIMDYDALLAAPKRVFGRVAKQLALGLDPVDVGRGVARVKPDRRHHHGEPVTDSAERARAVGLYGRILARKAGEAKIASRSRSDMAMPGVGIVMRTVDRPLFLPRAIRSVLAQTYPNWRLMLVNDGGDREALDIALEPYLPALRGRLTRVELAVRSGMEAASNAGVKASDTALVVIHDDDDSWAPTFLERSVAHIEETGAAGVVTGTMMIEERVEGRDIVQTGRLRLNPDLTEIRLSDLIVQNRFTTNAYVYRRSVYDAVGGYRESLPVLGDWDFNLRALLHAPVAFLPDALANWHRRAKSDPFPNSDDDLHRKIEKRIRDEWFRNDDSRALLIGSVRGDVESAIRAARDELRGMIGALDDRIARRLDSHRLKTGDATGHDVEATYDGPRNGLGLPVRWTLMPVASAGLAATDGSGRHESIGDDPNLLYHLPEALAPGRYLVECMLESDAPLDLVELFYSETGNFGQDRRVDMRWRDGTTYTAVIDNPGLIGRLRLDPMNRPGSFAGGMLSIFGMASEPEVAEVG